MFTTTNTTPAGADQSKSPSASRRRTFAVGSLASVIAALATLPSAPPAAAVALDGSPDQLLVQSCTRIVADCKEQAALQDQAADLPADDPGYDTLNSHIQELGAATRQLAERVGKMPARTPEGVQARATAIQAMMPECLKADEMVPMNWHAGMLEALLGDLIGRPSE